ncbi:MAG: UvrD-helicase domain-containing protein [Burkholderiales bacterium]|nr:UvrD-helicase domain-containing protein [Burkholderiales bacterium]
MAGFRLFDLNEAQREAVTTTDGPLLILAGAGTGKTRVITARAAYLIAQGVDPSAILAVTFTNKAANEMRERLATMIEKEQAKKVTMSTFHALCVRLLRSGIDRLGYKNNFAIYDDSDQTGLIRKIITRTAAKDEKLDHNIAKNLISKAKNNNWDAPTDDKTLIGTVFARYQAELKKLNAVDFDDLLVLAVRLLDGHPDVRARWQERFRYLMVDEFQDTNKLQLQLVTLLSSEERNVAVVGDDDQSIYGWRGATVENLKRLPADYPRLKVIPLEQNYRSTGSILRAANAVIANNPKLYEKKLWSELGAGDPVRVIECDNEVHEADRTVAHIESIRGSSNAELRDFAVLYRANHQARVFEQALRKAGIAYKVSGGQSFFDRAEIRDLCAWLRLIVNGDDDPAFLRAATSPKRGIGHQTLASLGTFAGRWKASLFEALFAETLDTALPRRSIETLHEFGRTINELEQKARETTGEAAARAFLLAWLKDIGYEQHLHDDADSPPQAAARWTNVLDFVDWIARRCGGSGAAATGDEVAAKSVLEVAQSISVILSMAERGDEQNVVTLSTLHAAKGLEWPHVVLAGVNEGLLPFRGAEGEEEQAMAVRIEEERRLMYVGITRARATLVVSTLARRKRGRETVAGVPSRFVAEMKLAEEGVRVDPRAQLRALRDAAARRAEGARADAPTQ